MTGPAVHVVRVAGSIDPLVDGTLDHWLGPAEARLSLELPEQGLPKQLDRQHRETWKSFKATPRPLVEGWRVARHVEAMVSPGDTVVFTDRGGPGGLFAIEQSGANTEHRCRTIVVAGGSRCLELLAVAGTIDGVGAALEFEIDQELAAYRFADQVITLAPLAADLLASLGIAATVVAEGNGGPTLKHPMRPAAVSIPEPFSRLAGTPSILRAIAGLPDEVRPKTITVSPGDQPDLVWTGTAWDAAGAQRQLLGNIVQRGVVESGDAVILGHPFALPPKEADSLRLQGAQVFVREGSTSAQLWPEAITWQGEDELASALRGEPRVSPKIPVTGSKPLMDRTRDDARARRVSAGVPVFANTRYLDACLESLLGQTQPLVEIVLIDDGSRSVQVTSALEKWHRRHPELIRVISQPNRGVCVARNSMLEEMTGDAFVLVDADDVLHPDFVASCGDVLRADSSVSAVATWTEFFGDYQGVEAKPPFDIRVGRRENAIISTCALVDMGIRDAGVRFTPDLAFLFCEDWDFWCQILANGGRFGLVPRPLARHRVHRSSGGFQRTLLAETLGHARATARLGGPRLLPSIPD